MLDDGGVVLPAAYIRELYESYQNLIEGCEALREALLADRGKYPVYIPTFGDGEIDAVSCSAREAAIQSMVQLFTLPKGSSVPDAGLVCASPESVRIVSQLNSAKDGFKRAVLTIRNFQKDTDTSVSRISKLIRDEVTEKGYRTEQLKQAFGTIGIGSLDLKRCYAHIRIMPPELDVFSWTWATNHTRIKKITLVEAIEMAKKLPNKETSDIALDLLHKCPSEEVFVKKASLPNQLRANYAYLEDGAIVRKSCPISGVVIAQQENLPRTFWRDNPGGQRRRPAQESKIEEEPYIIALNLYRYAQ